jgi:hypothetical protein
MAHDEIKTFLNSILTIYHPTKINWEPLENEKSKSALHRALREAYTWQTRGVFIDAGTLLGVVRDGHFIPHDTDLDIAILMDSTLIKKFRAPKVEIARSVYFNELPMQIAYLDQGILVDFYFYYLNKKGDFFINANAECVLKLPNNLLIPLQTMEVERIGQVPIPNRVEEYLEWTYGENWRMPKEKKSKWVKDRNNLGDLTDLEQSVLDL